MYVALTDGIFVFVSINASVDDIVKQIIHDVSKTLRTQHAMQRPDKHRLLRLQSVRRLADVVTV